MQTAMPTLSPRAETTRAEIVTTAERLFRSLGYQKTAVADIARELGMSPANIYRFFPSKAAINEAICARTLSFGRTRVADGAGSRRPGRPATPPIRRHAVRNHVLVLQREKAA